MNVVLAYRRAQLPCAARACEPYTFVAIMLRRGAATPPRPLPCIIDTDPGACAHMDTSGCMLTGSASLIVANCDLHPCHLIAFSLPRGPFLPLSLPLLSRAGIDDAMAILALLAAPEIVTIVGITIVHGSTLVHASHFVQASTWVCWWIFPCFPCFAHCGAVTLRGVACRRRRARRRHGQQFECHFGQSGTT